MALSLGRRWRKGGAARAERRVGCAGLGFRGCFPGLVKRGIFGFASPAAPGSEVLLFHNKHWVALTHLLVFHAFWGLCIALQLGQSEIRNT